jgi:hypothetical protein
MSKKVTDIPWEMLANGGVKRCYGIVGDALNPVIDALRRNGKIKFIRVHHEEYRVFAAVFVGAMLLLHGAAKAQTETCSSSLPEAPQVQIERGLGIFPIVQAPGARDSYAPLSAKQKFRAFVRTTFDPSAIVVAALGAGSAQPGNSQPQYGEGGEAFGQRVGAIAAGYGSATFFTADLLPTVLHQDPRYFRKGDGTVPSRIWYAATRTLVTRQDSGRSNINASFLGGFAMSVALSNSYYPDRNRNASDAASRYGLGLAVNAAINVVREFVVKPH